MTFSPAYDAFEAAYDAGRPQLVWARMIADLETPVAAMMKLADGQRNSFLFESVEGGRSRGRFSFIGLKPDIVWRCVDGRAAINRSARSDPDAFEACDAPPLDALRALLDESRIEIPDGLPPMSAGLFGYMGYDMVRLMERLPEPNPDPLGLPDSILLRPTLMLVFDSVTDEVVVVTPVRPEPGVSARAAHARAGERLNDTIDDLARSLPVGALGGQDHAPLPAPVSNTSREDYFEMVERAKAYIRAGDIFQVVPSQRFSVPFALPPFALYRALRRLNPSPYMFFLDFGDFSVVGSSPEILVRLRDETVTIRPIAGTRPRGKDAAEDAALAADLLGDVKERAEHLMLLDLGRNDVGRVSRPSTVTVTEQFTIENYSHVMHIVSNVEGRLSTDYDALSALCAGFPAGTVSGAPKVRAMEIIDELEKEKRGVYAGMVGYFAADGTMDNCIALRTAVVKDGTMYVQAGGGVVYDSDPEAEYQETVHKSRALIRAAEEAVRFAGSGRRSRL
jgi:anthranilate synthase component 1